MTVLAYLAKGLRVGQIAREMAISDRTVSTYKAHLLKKLNADSVVQLAEIAAQHGVGRPSPRALAEVSPGGRPSSRTPAQASPVGSALDLALAGKEILDAMPVALAIRDTDARLQFANAHYRAWLGDDASAFLAAGPDFQAGYLGLDEAERDTLRTNFDLAATEGRSYQQEVMIRRDGQVSVKINWGTPLRNEAGEVAAVLCGALDVTEMEAAFSKLRVAQARVQASIHATATVVCSHLERIGRMLAEVDAGIASHGNGLGELSARQQAAMAAVAELRVLVPTLSGPTRSPEPCVLAQAVAAAMARVDVASASRHVRFLLHLDDAGHIAALVDRERLSQMVTALARAASYAVSDTEVIVTLRAVPRRRGLLDVVLKRQSQATRQGDASQRDVAMAELQLCRRIAEMTGATLTASMAGEPFAVALHAVVPRAD